MVDMKWIFMELMKCVWYQVCIILVNRTTKLLHIRKVSLKPVKVHRRIFHLFPPKYWSYFRTQFSQIESKQNLEDRKFYVCYSNWQPTQKQVLWIQKREAFFFNRLILLYLGQGSLQHNFIIIVTMSLSAAMEAYASRQEFTLIICKAPPAHTLARISRKVNWIILNCTM